MRFPLHIAAATVIALFAAFACKETTRPVKMQSQRVFPGFHPLLDEIVRSRDGVFRGLNLNSNVADIRRAEKGEPSDSADHHLYYEYSVDSLTNYSIDYSLEGDSLEEISLEVNTLDVDLASYLFCDLKDYYANKLPNPKEDKGYVIYNCFEGQRKPFVVSLSDNSSPTRGQISMLIYKDK